MKKITLVILMLLTLFLSACQKNSSEELTQLLNHFGEHATGKLNDESIVQISNRELVSAKGNKYQTLNEIVFTTIKGYDFDAILFTVQFKDASIRKMKYKIVFDIKKIVTTREYDINISSNIQHIQEQFKRMLNVGDTIKIVFYDSTEISVKNLQIKQKEII